MRLPILLVIATVTALGAASGLSAQSSGAGEYFDGAISVMLIAPSEVVRDAPIEGFDIALVNHADEPFQFTYGGDLMNFRVVDENGDGVWWYFDGVIPSFLGEHSIRPRATLLLSSLRGSGDPRLAAKLGAGPEIRGVQGVVRLSVGPRETPYEAIQLETEIQDIRVRSPR